jgi:aspartate kinase
MTEPFLNVSQRAAPILVQKFGGSSVAHAEGRQMLVGKVRQAIADGHAPVVVVSAMGRRGDPYATDTLIGQLEFVPRDARDVRELDMLMACGEIISVVVCAHVLRQAGVPAAAIVGGEIGIATDGAHTEAHITAVDASTIAGCVGRGVVPVVAGFQGVAPSGDIVTLGRGGSDTTAVALGVALGARAVEIYSDVEGVMTVDPRVYSGARLIPRLSYEELGELAVEGAKVMHPRAVDLASAYDVPLRIRSTFSDHPGTTVRRDAPPDAMERQRVVTSITPLAPVSHVIVSLPSVSQQAKDRALSHLFERLTGIGISLDLINICPETLYFIVKQEFVEKVVDALEQLWLSHTVRRDCAKISLVGVGMRGTPGVVGRIHAALQRAAIGILHSTDSNITVSCLVDGADMPRAVEALHKEFLEADSLRSEA